MPFIVLQKMPVMLEVDDTVCYLVLIFHSDLYGSNDCTNSCFEVFNLIFCRIYFHLNLEVKMKMVRADVHLILLKATHLSWLVSSGFAYLIIAYKNVRSFHCHSPVS